MDLFEIIAIAVGLSMDAFAVAVCKGLAMEKAKLKHYLIVGLWFGGFQMLMPLIGYFLGSFFADMISAYDHWIAFILLVLIGVNMIREAFSKDDEEGADASLAIGTMAMMAVATSIDALAVGITFSFEIERGYIVLASGLIGVITFLLSALGVKIGNVFGTKYKSKAEFVGGAILVLIGLRVLLEGIGVI